QPVGNVKSSSPIFAYGDAGPLFILKMVIRSFLSAALVMKTRLPATLRSVHTPTGSVYMTWPGPSATPSPSASTNRRSAPEELKKTAVGLLVATRIEPSDSCAMPVGKFSPEANVVTRKSFGFTRGSPPIANCAAAGSAVTSADTTATSRLRRWTRRMVYVLLL